jgi:hypothetical protein
MGPLDVLNHLLNFVLPALALAAGVTLASRVFMRKQRIVGVFRTQFAINFIVAVATLALGLVLLGRDGKMLTYTALVLACASSQWWQMRGWK